MTTSAGGGPGSTATRSISWRPTWTFRARTVQPASVSLSATRVSAASPDSWAAVRSWSPGRSAMDRIVAGAAYPARTAESDGRSQLQGCEVERVEHRVVRHDRDELAGEAVIGLRRCRRIGQEVEVELVASQRPLKRKERSSVERGEAEGADGLAMVPRRIALVVLPAVPGITRGKESHHPVADDLGNDRRAGDRIDPRVAVDDVGVWPDSSLEAGDPVAVDEDVLVPTDLPDGPPHREMGRVVDVELVDLTNGCRAGAQTN